MRRALFSPALAASGCRQPATVATRPMVVGLVVGPGCGLAAGLPTRTQRRSYRRCAGDEKVSRDDWIVRASLTALCTARHG